MGIEYIFGAIIVAVCIIGIFKAITITIEEDSSNSNSNSDIGGHGSDDSDIFFSD